MNKKSLFLALMMVFAVTSLTLANPTTDTDGGFEVDLEKSYIVWKGAKVTGKHDGTVMLKSAELSWNDEGLLTGGSFEIDMTTIKNKDMEGKKGAAGLERHLKSEDFFGVEKYPTAKFEMTRVVPRGPDGEYKVIGNLTIKETTKEIKFNAVFADGSATATVQIDRSDFDVRYGSGSFFDNLGNKTIYDEFDLEIHLVSK